VTQGVARSFHSAVSDLLVKSLIVEVTII